MISDVITPRQRTVISDVRTNRQLSGDQYNVRTPRQLDVISDVRTPRQLSGDQ